METLQFRHRFGVGLLERLDVAVQVAEGGAGFGECFAELDSGGLVGEAGLEAPELIFDAVAAARNPDLSTRPNTPPKTDNACQPPSAYAYTRQGGVNLSQSLFLMISIRWIIVSIQSGSPP